MNQSTQSSWTDQAQNFTQLELNSKIDELNQQLAKMESQLLHLQNELQRSRFDNQSLKGRLAHHSQRLIETVEMSKLIQQDLDDFTYAAAHQLQSPLRNILGFLQLINRHYGENMDERGRQYLNISTENTQHLCSLLEDISFYTSLTGKSFETRPVLAEFALGQVIETLADLIRANDAVISFEDLPLIRANPYLFRLLVKELLTNAIKFKSHHQPEINVKARYENNDVIMSVRDNGMGIPKAYSDKVFKLFCRLHPSSKQPGTGLGLALCKKIVDLHSGQITYAPNTEGGTTFFVRLPMRQAY